MDDIHNSPEFHDLNKPNIAIESTYSCDRAENPKNLQSPIFKIVNNKSNKITPSRSGYAESPDYDFPSYQINQSYDIKTSSKSENENNYINLPSSPIFSPVIISSQRIRIPSIHSLDTIAKRCNSNFLIKNEKVKSNSGILKEEELFKKSNIYDNLQMTDLDISWVSSMASPPPPPPDSKFNTIERATFFPEDNFQKIQPRALFSPASDDNCGCSPLPITSGSEDEGQIEVYQSKARLSDVCSTLTELKFKSQEQLFPEEVKGDEDDCSYNKHLILSSDDNYYPKSPVFIVKPKESNLNEKKNIILNSEKLVTDLKTSPLKCKKEEKLNENPSFVNTLTNQSDENSKSKEDESFLDISFTQLDKMCNSVLVPKNKIDKINEPVPYLVDIFLNDSPKDFNINLLKNTHLEKRHYYLSDGSAEIKHTGKFFTSYDEILNANIDNVYDKLLNKNFGDNGNQLFNEMPQNKFKSLKNDKNDINLSAIEKIKSHSKVLNSSKIIESNTKEKKEKNNSLDALDEEERMLKAVEEAEKTLAEETQMSKVMDEMESTVVPNNLANVSTSKQFNDSHDSKIFDSFPEQLSKNTFINLDLNLKVKPSDNQFSNEFSTAAGLKVFVSKDALKKAKEFLKKCEEEVTCGRPNSSPKSFFVNAAKSDVFTDSIKESEESNMNQYEGALKYRLKEQVTISNLFKPIKSDRSEMDNEMSKSCINDSEFQSDFDKQSNKFEDLNCSTNSELKIVESKNICSRAKEFMPICDKNDSLTKVNEYSFASEPVRTSTPLPFQDHGKLFKKANCNNLKKQKLKMYVDTSSGIEENSWNDLKAISGIKKCTTASEKLDATSMPDFGFMTASGLKVGVSLEALINAKKLLHQCEIENDKDNAKDESSSFLAMSTKADDSKEKLIVSKCDNLFENRIGHSRSIKTTETVYKIPESKLPETQKKCEKNVKKNVNYDGGLLNNIKNNSVLENEILPTGTPPLESKNVLFDPNVGFSTASGVKISVSNEALLKAEELMTKMDDNFTNIRDSCLQNVSKLSTPQLSSEVLKKRRHESIFEKSINSEIKGDHNFMSIKPKFNDCAKAMTGEKSNYDFSESKLVSISSEQKVLKNDFSKCQLGFTTCLGKKVEVSAEALKKARELMSSCDEKSSIGDSILKNDLKSLTNDDDDLETGAFDNDVEKTKHSYQSADTKKNYLQYKKPKRILEKSGDTKEVKAFDHTLLKVKSSSKSETMETFHTKKDEMSSYFVEKENDCPTNDQESIKKMKFIEEEVKFEKEELDSLNKMFDDSYSPSPKKTGIKRCSEEILKSCKRLKYVEETITIFVLEERSKARTQQEIMIKEKGKVSPLVGSHLKKKLTVKQKALIQAVENTIPLTNVGDNMSTAEALAFKFQNFQDRLNDTIGIQLDDGFTIIPNDKNELGVEEFKRGFLAGPGVQPDLVPPNWIENHYKLIVWKLANYERDFPLYFKGKTLTPNNVMLQLKYRYDREIDRSHRSALKKILEKDDSSLKRLVLRVCEIKKLLSEKTTSYQLMLTDGWYCCSARVDSAMTKLIENRKILVGMKLITQGAILVNCDQGSSPLEISENVYLKMFTNSTRRVSWNAKLGFQKNPSNITVNLDSISPEGGLISRIDVIVVRVYPLLYAEKTTDGRRIIRNRRGEEEAESEYRRLMEQKMEIIYSKVRSEMKCEDINKMVEPFSQDDDIQRIKNSSDFSSVFSRQEQLNKEISKRVEEKLKKENLGRREVSELLKVKIVDLKKPIFSNPTILSLWNPSEDVIGFFTEGTAISLMNLSVNNYTRGNNVKHINTTRQTRFEKLSRKCEYPIRKLTFLKNILNEVPNFGEIDLVGIVLSMEDSSCFKSTSNMIYLADSEFNFVGLSFCSSPKILGWENILVRRRIVACTNVYWTSKTHAKEIPILQVNETSAFTENPKAEYLKKGLEDLKKNLPKDINQFLSECEEILTSKLNNLKDSIEIIGREKMETSSNIMHEGPDENQTEAEASSISAQVEKSETISTTKNVEKIPKLGGRSYFRWLPYKNI